MTDKNNYSYNVASTCTYNSEMDDEAAKIAWLQKEQEYKSKNIKILMHCFTGTKLFAEKLLTLNAYFSASGIITFKNAQDLQETFKFLPLDKVLIETDSPF